MFVVLNTIDHQQYWQIYPRYVIYYDNLFYNPYLVATVIRLSYKNFPRVLSLPYSHCDPLLMALIIPDVRYFNALLPSSS